MTIIQELLVPGTRVHINTVAHAMVGTVIRWDDTAVLLEDVQLISDEGIPSVPPQYARVYDMAAFGKMCIVLGGILVVRQL